MRIMTKDEADAYIEHYNKNRCTCGGSPLFLDPNEAPITHLAACTAIRDYQGEHGEYPWQTHEKAPGD